MSPLELEHQRRLNPPRLQHSPSLPNLSAQQCRPSLTEHEPHQSIPHSLDVLCADLPPEDDLNGAYCELPAPHAEADADRRDLIAEERRDVHLLTRLSALSIDPAAEKRQNTYEHGHDQETDKPSHFLLIGNVPPRIPTSTLKDTFFSTLSTAFSIDTDVERVTAEHANKNPIKGIYVRHQESRGVVVLAFYDLRESQRAHTFLTSKEVFPPHASSWERAVTCSFVCSSALLQIIGPSTFVSETDGSFLLETVPRGLMNAKSVQNLLESFGALSRLSSSSSSKGDAESDSETYHVEYFDVRDAGAARAALRERTMFGTRMRISPTSSRSSPNGANAQSHVEDVREEEVETPLIFTSLSPPPGLAHPGNSFIPFPALQPLKPLDEENYREHRRMRPRSVSAGDHSHRSPTDTGTETPSSQSADEEPSSSTPPTSPSVSPVDVRRCSGGVFFDADVPVDVEHERATPPYYTSPPRQHQQPTPASYFYNAPHYPPYYPPSLPLSPVLPHALEQAIHFPLPPASTNYGYHPEPANIGSWSWASASVQPPVAAHHGPQYGAGQHHHQHVQSQNMGGGTTYYPVPMFYPPPHQQQPVLLPFGDEEGVDQHRQHGYHRQYEEFIPHGQVHSHAPYTFYPSSPSPPLPPPLSIPSAPEQPERRIHNAPCSAARAEKNQLDLGLIEQGLDTRTTVMVKNIPNKMSDKDLIAYIGTVCPRKIDFLYLRMDFQNGCNVGYAFVNFIYVEDLLNFAKAKLGIKWNMFSSEKVLQMSYANYQGKEALVEKFKNSCIMDEREAWRPKIFHSQPGPDQGVTEPFPAPTHLRRKERGTYQRGALYVPGIGGRAEGGREHHHHLHNATRSSRAVDVESSEPDVLADEAQVNSHVRPGHRSKKGHHLLLNRPQ